MAIAAALVLRAGDRPRLERMARSSSIRAGLAQRARIVLLAADGLPNAEIARRTGTSRPTVVGWRARYDAGGITALHDQPRSGRPPEIDEIDVVVATLADDGRPPARLRAPHWSARLLGAHLGVSFTSVARIWRKWGLQPWRLQSFAFATEPELDARIRDVVGLYLNPPERVVVLCVDEKPQVHALGRAVVEVSNQPGKQTRDPAGTLLGELERATGRVERVRPPAHRHHEFLRFLDQLAAAHPRRKLHLVCDSHATQKAPVVKAWLARHRRISVHVTRQPGSWLDLVEVFFGIVVRHAARRGDVDAVRELAEAIAAFLDRRDECCRPFLWTGVTDPMPIARMQ
jgi:transposase